MRKKLMLILCLILCAGMLAACSGEIKTSASLSFPRSLSRTTTLLRRRMPPALLHQKRKANPWWMN